MPDRRFTVLYVHSSADLYGSDVALLNLVTRLPDTIRPIVLLPEEGPLAERLRERTIDTTVFPLAVPRRYYFHPMRVHRLLTLLAEFLTCRQKMRRLIRRERVDIVHLNVSILLAPAWVARGCGKPILWHCREIFPQRGWWRRLLIGAAERWATRIVCISNAVREQFHPSAKACVVFDAVVPEELETQDSAPVRRQLGLRPGDLCVGIVGRLNDWKGQDVLIRAAPRILQQFPTAVFLVVGDVYKKNEAIRRDLQRLTEELGIRSRVLFTGFRTDVSRLLDVMDVFVLASKRPEPFGIVQLEAMMKGRPVVATDRGGPLDVVLEGETGFLVPPNDPESLATKIIELLENPGLRAAMGRKGRQRVLDLFTIDRQLRDVVAIYSAIVGDGQEEGDRQ
jgi:glycosyltransferase involved in cell wall biosynthesis